MTVYVVMGVAGSGKSTVGRMLAQALSLPFVEGDDFHSPSNRRTMAGGTPLSNEDRRPWIDAITAELGRREGSCVLACSALDATVRRWLLDGLHDDAVFIVLHAPRPRLEARLRARTGHFFDPALLDSQLATFDPPRDALTLRADEEPSALCDRIVEELRRRGQLPGSS